MNKNIQINLINNTIIMSSSKDHSHNIKPSSLSRTTPPLHQYSTLWRQIKKYSLIYCFTFLPDATHPVNYYVCCYSFSFVKDLLNKLLYIKVNSCSIHNYRWLKLTIYIFNRVIIFFKVLWVHLSWLTSERAQSWAFYIRAELWEFFFFFNILEFEKLKFKLCGLWIYTELLWWWS